MRPLRGSNEPLEPLQLVILRLLNLAHPRRDGGPPR